MRKIIVIVCCFFLVGCSENLNGYIDENKLISISYPITGINILDDRISAYVENTYRNFKDDYDDKSELNISYKYKEVNNHIVNVCINTYIYNGTKINRIKTFMYDKASDNFLTMDDVVRDLDVLDYEFKEGLIDKYDDLDMSNLNNLNYSSFTIDDDNLTIYLNTSQVKNKSELIYLDIPLNSLKLLIDIDKSKANDTYFNIKKRNLDIDDKIVALTFDDGPSKYTKGIVDILKRNKACATFFVIGNRVDFYDEVLNEMIKSCNEIGNHSYSHKWLSRLSEDEFKREIDLTQKEIKKSTGFTPTLFRPTYGGYSDRLKKYTDLNFILWDVDSMDWKVKNKNKIFNNIIGGVRNGSIVLMHDNHRYSLEALDSVIKWLKINGYNFVTVSELLEIKKLREADD